MVQCQGTPLPLSPLTESGNIYLMQAWLVLSSVCTQDRVPLFPFGHGLTYTTFNYERLQVHPWL
jgi:hypothetical protein